MVPLSVVTCTAVNARWTTLVPLKPVQTSSITDWEVTDTAPVSAAVMLRLLCPTGVALNAEPVIVLTASVRQEMEPFDPVAVATTL
jgi:hypothetical protein